MNYLDFLILYCTHKFNGERSVSATYHLLVGKKSSQTIQDSIIFRLSPLFGLFPELERSQILNSTERMAANQFLDESLKLTRAGLEYIENMKLHKPIPASLNGWEYGNEARVMWRRLTIFTQVISNLVYEKKRYLPVTKNEEDLFWVKNFLQRNGASKEVLAKQLHDELRDILSQCSNTEASIFVLKLTSSTRIGLTSAQLAEKFADDLYYIQLLFWNIIHFIVRKLKGNTKSYSLLQYMISDLKKEKNFTASTLATFNLLKKGLEVEQIANIRQLKKSTIEDHIVEIALNDPNTDLSAFISLDDYNTIREVIEKLHTTQLKMVKQHLEQPYSYFQIRLAFAMYRRDK
ncbi:helix-turn-helix domain-containing protein [Metabacillus fastidiosus]|uniref:helix-turn-helix domain-containing protein n=1 Tax=Metabacillus fastidiosus TaxID=1458 RepID=UPI003D2A1DB6